MNQGAKKILMVEDEVKIIEVVKAFLESRGFAVASATRGRQALEAFRQDAPALVLLDLMLPDMSGEELCAEIRRHSRVPIIMLTAKVQEKDQVAGLALGADDYILKPFSLSLLGARVDAVLRRAAEAPATEKAFFGNGDLEIDLAGHEVRKAGRPVSLTHNEFRLLTVLAGHPNKVFSREELILAALGDDFDGYDRAVDGYIKNIRQKIETDPKNPAYVLTVHGVGYKFGGARP